MPAAQRVSSHLTVISGGPPPDIHHHNGRGVQWQSWKRTVPLSCLRNPGCDRCRSTALPWIAQGLIVPKPGETVAVAGRKVPAWTVARLVAFRCWACRHTVIYDRGPDGGSFDELPPAQQLTLF